MKRIKERGITLVALVVTIIILLILAGVTIAQISGENGLFSRVRQAVEKYKDASIEEQEQILEIEKFVSEFSTTEQEGVTVKIIKLEVTAGTDSIEVLVEVEGEPSKIEYSIDNGKTYQTKEEDITSRTYKYENLKPGGYFIKVRVYDAEEKYQEATSDIVTVTPITTAEEGDVLEKETFLTGEGIIKTGSMKKHETIEATIQPGGKYTIEEGYYEGGTITAEGLGNNTPGTAGEWDILKDKTAWVNGEQVTGLIPNHEGTNIEVTEKETPIPKGYYDGSGKIMATKIFGEKDLVLLWENDKPNDSFPGKTINLDLSEYSKVCVILSEGGGLCEIGSSISVRSYAGRTNAEYYLPQRMVTALDNGVTFGNGELAHDSGYNSTDNSCQIPLYIWGMRKQETKT